MWTQIDFSLTPKANESLFGGEPRTGRTFRKLLAELDTKHGIGLPSSFFGYGPDGLVDPGADITIVMGYTHGGLRLVGLGYAACKLINDRAGAINAALMHAANALIPMNVRGGEHGATLLPFARNYYLKSMAVGKSQKKCIWNDFADQVKAGAKWYEVADRMLPLFISRSLLRQAVLLIREGDDINGNVEPLLAKSEQGEVPWKDTGKTFGNRLGVKVHNVETHTFADLGDGRHRLILKGVEFTMRAELEGPWFIGRLKMQGNGEIYPATGAWTQSVQEAA